MGKKTSKTSKIEEMFYNYPCMKEEGKKMIEIWTDDEAENIRKKLKQDTNAFGQSIEETNPFEISLDGNKH